jgi:hypothetical protein
METKREEAKPYNEITEDDIKEALKELGLDAFPNYGYIGNGIYQIGDRCFTVKEGWDSFNLALQKEGKKYLKQK